MSITSKSISSLNRIRINLKLPQNPKYSNEFSSRHMLVSLFSSKSYRKRVNRRNLAASKPTLDEFQFHRAISHLLPRFKPEELHNLINLQQDPLVCLELFNWASKQPRFTHDVSTYHITIKKLGAAKMYDEMDQIINEAKGFVPSSKSYNSLVNSLALEGELDLAASCLLEMMENQRSADYITYWTLLDECCRRKRCADAISLLNEWREKRFVDGDTCRKLRYELEVNYGNLYDGNGPPR